MNQKIYFIMLTDTDFFTAFGSFIWFVWSFFDNIMFSNEIYTLCYPPSFFFVFLFICRVN